MAAGGGLGKRLSELRTLESNGRPSANCRACLDSRNGIAYALRAGLGLWWWRWRVAPRTPAGARRGPPDWESPEVARHANSATCASRSSSASSPAAAAPRGANERGSDTWAPLSRWCEANRLAAPRSLGRGAIARLCAEHS